MQTSSGDVMLMLRPEWAPQHVVSTAYLAMSGYYDGLSFHRVIPGFMVCWLCYVVSQVAEQGMR